jgi:hypothetical protein
MTPPPSFKGRPGKNRLLQILPAAGWRSAASVSVGGAGAELRRARDERRQQQLPY